jgi:hypothetical protein
MLDGLMVGYMGCLIHDEEKIDESLLIEDEE